MKKLFPILFLFLAALSVRAGYVTATVTITNVSSLNGSNIVVNGNTRTWYNSVTNSGTQIQTTNVIGYAASNLFNHIAGSGFAGVALARSGTNGITLAGVNLTVTASAGYCTISLATNTTGGGVVGVVVPFNSTYTGTNLPYVASQLVADIDANSTTAFSAASPTMVNFANLSAAQTFTGAKLFSNPAQVFNGGTVTNAALTNITQFSGSNGIIWALILVNPSLTNGQNFGTPFRSPGTGTASEQFGFIALATGDYSTALGNATIASGQGSSAVGALAEATEDDASAFGYQSHAYGPFATAIGNAASIDSSHTNSTALGRGAATTDSHQVMLGTSAENVAIPGGLLVSGSISNATFAGSVTLNNKLIIPKKSISTLVNSPSVNLVSTSTNCFLRVTGPTGAFSIGSLDGGADGRFIFVLNPTGQAMTVVHESGADGTAANRIVNTTGADVTISGSVQLVMFLYDTVQSRWILGPHN